MHFMDLFAIVDFLSNYEHWKPIARNEAPIFKILRWSFYRLLSPETKSVTPQFFCISDTSNSYIRHSQ